MAIARRVTAANASDICNHSLLFKTVANIIGSISTNDIKSEQVKNAYSDLILIDQQLRLLADHSLEHVIVYIHFCDPIANTMTLNAIFDLLDKALKLIEPEKNSKSSFSKNSEFLSNGGGEMENLSLSIQRMSKLIDGVKADFDSEIIKCDFKDIVEFYADFFTSYKPIVPLDLEKDPVELSKFQNLKKRLSISGDITKRTQIKVDKMNMLNTFVKTYVMYENKKDNLLLEFHELQKLGLLFTGPQNLKNRVKIKHVSKSFANTIEHLINLYQESLRMNVIHQYKTINSGVNNINSAMIKTLQIAQSISKAINSIVNSNDESKYLEDAAILKLANNLKAAHAIL